MSIIWLMVYLAPLIRISFLFMSYQQIPTIFYKLWASYLLMSKFRSFGESSGLSLPVVCVCPRTISEVLLQREEQYIPTMVYKKLAGADDTLWFFSACLFQQRTPTLDVICVRYSLIWYSYLLLVECFMGPILEI